MKLYEALYCPCIHESADATLSLHYTKAGAYKAMKAHKLEEYRRWLERPRYFRRSIKFAAHQAWRVGSIEIKS